MFHTHTAAFHKHVLVPAVAAALTVTVLELMTCAPGPGRPGNFDEQGRAVMLEGRRSDWRFERYAACNTYTATAGRTQKALCLTLLVAKGALWTFHNVESLFLFILRHTHGMFQQNLRAFARASNAAMHT
jgi:hypothetical protein